MIRKLQVKLIALSMTALFVLLFAIVVSMNVLNYKAVVTEADQMLSMIAQNRGIFPEFEKNRRPPDLSPEAPYEARYFSVLLSIHDEVLKVDTGQIKAINDKQAIDYAKQVVTENRTRGFYDSYRFTRYVEGNAVRVIFLDCGRQLNAFKTFLFISVGMSVAGYIICFVAVLFFSNRIIRPVAESYAKQKQFITNAGHEIKTPLTIIKADVDVLTMEGKDNEWLSDILLQTDRLTALTNDLVYLSRMEEENTPLPMIEFPFSDMVSETAASFTAMAKVQNKVLQQSIQPFVSYTGNEKALQQLITILLDNALKYTPEHGEIRIALEKYKKKVRLSVYNTSERLISNENLRFMFERFYRMDPSRDSQTGGYGIGLSIAKAIVEAHDGKIEAKTDDGHSLCITILLSI